MEYYPFWRFCQHSQKFRRSRRRNTYPISPADASPVASTRACRPSAVGINPIAWTAAARTRGDGSLAAMRSAARTFWFCMAESNRISEAAVTSSLFGSVIWASMSARFAQSRLRAASISAARLRTDACSPVSATPACTCQPTQRLCRCGRCCRHSVMPRYGSAWGFFMGGRSAGTGQGGAPATPGDRRGPGGRIRRDDTHPRTNTRLIISTFNI
jgi:hypothetical protein